MTEDRNELCIESIDVPERRIGELTRAEPLDILSRRAVAGIAETRFDGDEPTSENLERGTLEDGVIEACDAITQREFTSRRGENERPAICDAVRLLRRSCMRAGRETEELVLIEHVEVELEKAVRHTMGKLIVGLNPLDKIALLLVLEAGVESDAPVTARELLPRFRSASDRQAYDWRSPKRSLETGLDSLEFLEVVERVDRGYTLLIDPGVAIEHLPRGKDADVFAGEVEELLDG